MFRRAGDNLAIVEVGDGLRHYGYESALNSLCLQPIKVVLEVRTSQTPSDCLLCNETLRAFKLAGVEQGADRCPATTKAGHQCVRDPNPGQTYCPSHLHLEQVAV
jgi:hypothetical protein